MTVLEQYSLSITCYYEIKERRKKGGINTKILKNRHHVDLFFSPGRRKAVSDNWRSRGPAATHLPFACVLASLMTDRLRLSCFTRKETEELRNSCVPGHAASMVWLASEDKAGPPPNPPRPGKTPFLKRRPPRRHTLLQTGIQGSRSASQLFGKRRPTKENAENATAKEVRSAAAHSRRRGEETRR